MNNLQPTTAIFLIGSGAYMLDFYNFINLKKLNNLRLVAIVNEEIISAFPHKQKYFFDYIYTIRKSNKSTLCHLNVDDVEESIKAELLQAKSPNKLRLFPFNEYNVSIAAYLRKKFGIPGANPQLVNPFRDKFVMKSILEKNNIRIPRFLSVDLDILTTGSCNYFHEIATQIGIPFIVKPLDGAGGLGIKKISSLSDFEIFKKEILTTVSGYEAEEYLDGDLFHCDILFKDQKPILSLCAKYNYPLLDFKHGKNVGSIPLLDEHPLKQDLIQFTLTALKNFQLPDGIIHTEIFYLSKTNEFVFLETAARAPGSFIVPMYEKSFGINILDVDFNIHMNQFSENKKETDSFCFWAVFPPISGQIKRLVTPELKSKCKLEWFTKVGEIVSQAVSMRDRVGRIFVWNKDYDILQQDFEYISNNNFIEVEL